MLKELAAIAVLGALMFGRPCVAEDHKTAHAATRKSDQTGKPVEPTHVVIDPPLPPSGSKPEPTNSQGQTQEKPLPRFERPEWVIVYVTILYSFIAWRTLRAIKRQADTMDKQSADSAKFAADTLEEMRLQRKQTKWDMGKQSYEIEQQTSALHASVRVAEKSAEAALLNAQAVINAERALLLFVVDKVHGSPGTGTATFPIRVKNYGKVPARRLVISTPIHATMKLEDLVAMPPDYGEDIDEIKEYLAPGDTWLVTTFAPSLRDRATAAISAKVKLDEIESMIYGQVTYYDGISQDERHSRYCFAHDKDEFSNIGGSVSPTGNEEYLECT